MNRIEQGDMQFVAFNENDMQGLVDLAGTVGWDYDANEIKTVLASGKVFGHKNEEGKIVSSAAIFNYDNTLATLGLVIVREAYRGLGLGKKAVQSCLTYASNRKIMLIATEGGKPLYVKLGFKTVDTVQKFLCDWYEKAEPMDYPQGIYIEAMNEDDLGELVSIDGAAFGDMRSHFLEQRIHQANEAVVVKNQWNNIIGYGLAIVGPSNVVLGPIVAPNHYVAIMLIDKLAQGHDKKLRIDVPSGQKDFLPLLQQCGFYKVNHPPVMILNADEMPERNNTLFGIAAQAYG